MNLLTYDYPFVYFGVFGIKLPLIVLYMCLLTLVIFWVLRNKNAEYEVNVNLFVGNIGQRNKFFLFLISYIALLPIYFFRELSSSSDNILMTIAKNFLKYENLMSLVVMLALAYSIVIHKNKDKYLNVIKDIVAVAIFVDLLCTFITKQINLFSYYNIFCYLIIGITFMLLISSEINTRENKEERMSYFAPIKKYEDLFPFRQTQAHELINAIENSKNGAISICVAGDWGSGKTSFVNGALDKLNKSSNRMYEYIFINALEIDNPQSLFIYFFNCIKICLKKRGAYIGVASEYQTFISSAVGVITHESFGTLVSKKIGGQSKEYRIEKEELEKLLFKVLENDKIIVVVDDIERCDKEKARQFIFFIKEIATMKNCISIFLTDYAHLTKSGIQDEKSNFIFFEKFFNLRINLINIPYAQAMPYFEQEKFLKGSLASSKFKKPLEIVEIITDHYKRRIIEEENKRITDFSRKTEEEKEKENRINVIRNLQVRFLQLLEHPRSLTKLYHTFANYINRINTVYTDEIIEKDSIKIIKYLEKINFSETLFILSYIEACIPSEFEDIKANGIWIYLNDLYEASKSNPDKQLIISIAQDYWFSKPLYYITTNYVQIDAMKFIDALLNNSKDMINLINSFTSKEEEWFTAIENDDLDFNENNWYDVANAVLRTFSYENSTKGEHYLLEIYRHLKKKINNRESDVNEVFKIFDHKWRNERLLSDNLYTMEMFYNIFCKDNLSPNFSNETIKHLALFSQEYISYRLDILIKLLYYFAKPNKDESIIKHSKESFMYFNKNISERLSKFLSDISPLIRVEGEDRFEKLNKLVKEIENYLEDKNLMQYTDVRDDVERARKSVNDLYWFYKIVECTESQMDIADSFDMNLIDSNNISREISYFTKVFTSEERPKQSVIRQQFSDFFNFLKYAENIRISNHQINELHSLVTTYIEITQHNTMFYRKVLLDISEKMAEQ
jgi:hypothetical protein